MTSPFMEDYSSEDYEDDYCLVPEVQQKTHPIDDPRSNEPTIPWLEIASESDHEVPNAVEAEATIASPAPALTAMESTREATVPIHQCQEFSLETFLSMGCNPAFMLQECRTMLKNWIERFLYDLARLRIRFYRAVCALFRQPFAWATRKNE